MVMLTISFNTNIIALPKAKKAESSGSDSEEEITKKPMQKKKELKPKAKPAKKGMIYETWTFI